MTKRWLLALGLLTGVSWAGEISGTVTLTSKPGERKVGESRAAAGYGENTDVPSPTESELEDVVIYLEGKDLPCTPLVGSNDPRNTVMQKNKEFVPHVLPLPKGSKVYFRNQDPFPHHIYSVSAPGTFEIAKHGRTVRSQEFSKSGEIEMFCGIHTKMNAYVLVLDTNCYSTVSSAGKYRISGVPAGQYTLVMWHPRLARAEKRGISVPASGSVKLDLQF